MTNAKKEKAKISEAPPLPSGEKKPHKKPAPVKFYALVEYACFVEGDKSKEDGIFVPVDIVEKVIEVEADKKSELYEKLSALKNPKILLLVRGRKITLTQKVSWKI